MKSLVLSAVVFLSAFTAQATMMECYKYQKNPFEKQSLNVDLSKGSGVFYVMNSNTFEISEEGWYQIGFLTKLKVSTSDSNVSITGSGLKLSLDRKNVLKTCFNPKSTCYQATMTLNPAIKDVTVMSLNQTKIPCRFTSK